MFHLLRHRLFSTDINECTNGRAECHDNASCTNTDGSYECTCDTGFTGDGFNCTSEIAIIIKCIYLLKSHHCYQRIISSVALSLNEILLL